MCITRLWRKLDRKQNDNNIHNLKRKTSSFLQLALHASLLINAFKAMKLYCNTAGYILNRCIILIHI